MKLSPRRRRFQIRRGKKRKEKLQKLKARYFTAKLSGEKEIIISKIRAIAPSLKVEEYLEVKK